MNAYLLLGLAFLAFLAIAMLGLGILIWSAKRAPMGYEDKTGFHEGKEP